MRPSPQKLLEWIKPGVPTDEELQCMKLLQPGDYEIYTEKLNNFLLESKEVFLKLGVSSMLRSGDLVTGIYAPSGDMVAAWLTEEESTRILKQMEAEAPKMKIGFREGESVRVTDGPFLDFIGVVESINSEKGKVKVLLSLFGRSTPVELDFLQVEKL